MPASREFTSQRVRLRERIHRSYVTTTDEVQFGDLTIMFTRIADPNRVLDQVAEEVDRQERRTARRSNDDDLHLPYWAELWESALGLSQFLTRAGQRIAPDPILRPLSVLDLGCGMGLCGAVAASIGWRVTFADIERPALLFARLNSLPWQDRVRVRRLDWRTDRLAESFDVILGADILYQRDQWEFLESFWREHLSATGTVLLGEPGRQTGDLFIEWVKLRPWHIKITEEKIAGKDKPIRIFELRPGRM